jgi:tRNA 2-thiocytidine biosynthesis protein TtcA
VSTPLTIALPRRGARRPPRRPEDRLRALAHRVGRAIEEFGLIEDGDRILVAMSGGKDSHALLHVLEHLRRRAPVTFSLVAVTVDQGYRGFQADVMERYFQERGYEYHIERTNIATVIDDTMAMDDTHCSMCARLRRGVLYRLAPELRCNKIALGHHADDLLETLLMGQFFNGIIGSMPPLLRAGDGRNTVIRPMCYVWEDEIIAYVTEAGFPVIGCACPACGDVSLKRKQMKELLRRLEAGHPGIKTSMLRALANVRPRHLLDRRLVAETVAPAPQKKEGAAASAAAAPSTVGRSPRPLEGANLGRRASRHVGSPQTSMD